MRRTPVSPKLSASKNSSVIFNNNKIHLQVIQNRTDRFVLNCPPISNRADMLNKLGLLSVRQMIAYHSLLLVNQMRVPNQPEYLTAKFNRVDYNSNFILNTTPLELYRNSLISNIIVYIILFLLWKQ